MCNKTEKSIGSISSKSNCSQETMFFKDSIDRVNEYGCVLSCCRSCSFCKYHRASPQKKGIRPVPSVKEIKHVKGVSCVNPCLSAQVVESAPHVVKELGVGGRLQSFWLKWQKLGANPRVVSILKEGYVPPFRMRPPLTRFPLEWLCKPGKEPVSKRGLDCFDRKVGSRKSDCSDVLSFLQPVVPGPKAQQKVETHSGSQSIECVSPTGYFQDGNSGNYQSIPSERGMGYVSGFQRRIFPHPHTSEIQEIPF